MDLAFDAPRQGSATGLLRRVVTVLVAALCVSAGVPGSHVDSPSSLSTPSAVPGQEELSITSTATENPSRRSVARRRRWAGPMRLGPVVARVQALAEGLEWQWNPIVPRLRRGPPARVA